MTAPVYQGHDLPMPIQRAIARLMDPALPVDLSASERMALAALLRRVEARDGAREFWVRRCNMAAMFDCVERTITNWLAALEHKGLIVKEQGRTRWGNFRSLTLHLTAKAISLLGLGDDALAQLSTAEGKKVSCGHKRDVYQEQSLAERHSAAPGSFQQEGRTARGQVPQDCEPLLSMGLTAPAVFRLMAIATQHGKRLGDVVQARRLQIEQSRNRFAFARKLASDQVDYAAVLQHEQHRQESEAADRERRSAVEDARSRLVGSVFELNPTHRAHVKNGYVEVMSLVAGAWRYVGALAGEGLLQFWDRAARGQITVAAPS